MMTHWERSKAEMIKAPEDCLSMDDIRVEIDRLDRELIDLMAERFKYVDQAWQIKKGGPEGAMVPWRVQQVIDKVRARADRTPYLIDPSPT